MVRIMIADDHALMRRVVREVVEAENDLEVVAEACNGHETEAQAAQIQPDVVLMDLDMPDCDGFEAMERVLACSPNSRIIILTASRQEQHAFQAMQRGAIGYLTKDIEADALVNAIRSAARDELCLPRSLATQVLAHLRALGSGSQHTQSASNLPQHSANQSVNGQGKMRALSEREREILDLIRRGRKNREIAKELSIAESTVHKHIQNIFEKLHARNRTEAIYLMTSRAL